jgi:3-hydroxyacyl-CoA dehydrogenase/3a,7a,12a-trihydroxy-5b-cholest-24-enoyl-CoA hydratase
MASQKLMFLKKIDPKRGAEVVAKLRASGGGAAATATASTSSKKEPRAPAIFKALGERLQKTPNLAKEVAAVIQFVVDDATYLADFKGAGAITQGTGKADVTVKLSDDDLEALAKGEPLRDLYQHGRVRIDGDPRIAHKLTFFKGLV